MQAALDAATAQHQSGHQLTRAEAQRVLEAQQVWLEAKDIERLFAAVAIPSADGTELVDVDELVDVLDWRQPVCDGNGQDATQRRQAHETADRIFGVPSIRTDRQPPRRMPVDNVTNYGDPTTSRTLLIPDRYTLQGIPDRELSRDRSLEDIAQLMSAAEIRVGSDTLESAYATVAANHNGHVSLRSLLHQLNTSGRQKK